MYIHIHMCVYHAGVYRICRYVGIYTRGIFYEALINVENLYLWSLGERGAWGVASGLAGLGLGGARSSVIDGLGFRVQGSGFSTCSFMGTCKWVYR